LGENTIRREGWHVNPKRSFQRRTTSNNRNFFQKVNTAKGKVNTARPNSAVPNVIRAKLGGAKAGKITGKGKIRTGKLDFEDVYIVKLADKSHLLLKDPRKNNMYSVDIKNIVPKKDLTCLVAKATNDESMLWHRRLGIKREYSVARTPQQNKVAEKRNKTLIENMVLVVKPYFKTPYELFRDHLGKFDGKSDEGFFVSYSTNSKAFRVYNTRTRKVDENLHIKFLENKPLIACDGPKWLFDIDTLTESMNYVPVIAGTNSNDFAGKGASFDAVLKMLTVGASINTASSNINIASPTVNTVRRSDDFFGADNDMRSLDGVEVDISNISSTYPIPTTLNTRIYKDHSLDNVIGDIQFGVQTRRMTVTTDKQRFISAIYEEKTHEDLHTCLFACFLSQEEPKRNTNALKDIAWVEEMQEELLQFHLQRVWTLVDLPRGKRAIGTKWVFRNKKDERGIMEIKSAFLYGRIKEEVYVCQPLGFEDPDYPDKVYKVEKALYGWHQAPRELCIEFKELMHHKFQMSSMRELTFFLGLQVKQYLDEIFISQDKYIDEILRKFKYEDVKTASTSMDKEKALLKDSDGDDVDVHLYRSMIRRMLVFRVQIDIMAVQKQTVVATPTTEAEYVASATCYGQVLWIQNQLLDYGLTFTGEAQQIWLSLILDNKMIKYELLNGFASTLDNREIELNATVDGQVKTITEASVRRHLKLADAVGISTLPTTEIFEELALMGYGEGPTSPVGTQHAPTVIETSPQLQNKSITYRKTRTKTRRMGIRIPQSNVPTSITDDAITKEMHDGLRRATTTASSLEAEQGSGDSPVQARPERLYNLPNELPLGEDKVTTLENNLTSTKAVYNMALITLTKRVKKLEKKLKHKRRRAVIDSSNDEESSLDYVDSPKQGRMIKKLMKMKCKLGLKQRSATKDKGKAIMQESEPPKKIKKKEMMQISLDEEITQRFYKEEQAQILMDEEYAQQVQDQWISDEARLDQENLAQVEQWDDV
nr:hypothetical protein [Tanacetum cinerariifolium]